MKKILLLPLDERPCNYDYTRLMTGGTGFEIVLPPKEILSSKKTPGNVERIWEWVEETAPSCCGAVLSIDTLVYSGILASRLHSFHENEMLNRVERLRKLKEDNPGLRLFAFSLIMRNPRYSSADEEPDYYGDWGSEIHRKGYISHRLDAGIATGKEKSELKEIEKKLPAEYWNDYVGRRKKNIQVNLRAIDLTKEGVIDFLIIPQDDSSPYGLTAQDQQIVRAHIRETGQMLRCYMYPDADAVENTLTVRLINEQVGRRPLVYIKYASSLGDTVTPLYEDRIINETIKYQVLAAGGLCAASVSEADIILMVNMPSGNLLEHDPFHPLPHTIEYDANRNQIELVEYADYAMRILRKEVCFADVAYGNGGDPELFTLLKLKGLTFRVAGYAGWNTSSNTLGTCIPLSMLHLLFGDRPAHQDFLSLRYLEDVGYMAFVRSEICRNDLKKNNCDYFQLDGPRGKVAQLIHEKLQEFADRQLSDEDHKVVIEDCCQPWNRMFEVGLRVRCINPNLTTRSRIQVIGE